MPVKKKKKLFRAHMPVLKYYGHICLYGHLCLYGHRCPHTGTYACKKKKKTRVPTGTYAPRVPTGTYAPQGTCTVLVNSPEQPAHFGHICP